MTRAGARFSRVEPRRRARAFVLGLLAELPQRLLHGVVAGRAYLPAPAALHGIDGTLGLDRGVVRCAPASSTIPASPASSAAHRVTVSLSLLPVSHASTATMTGTEAISRPLRELG